MVSHSSSVYLIYLPYIVANIFGNQLPPLDTNHYKMLVRSASHWIESIQRARYYQKRKKYYQISRTLDNFLSFLQVTKATKSVGVMKNQLQNE
jgi:hypothetical protein